MDAKQVYDKVNKEIFIVCCNIGAIISNEDIVPDNFYSRLDELRDLRINIEEELEDLTQKDIGMSLKEEVKRVLNLKV